MKITEYKTNLQVCGAPVFHSGVEEESLTLMLPADDYFYLSKSVVLQTSEDMKDETSDKVVQ